MQIGRSIFAVAGAARRPAAAQLPAHPGLVRGQRRAGRDRAAWLTGHARRAALAGGGGGGRAGRPGRLLHPGPRPVAHPGLGDRGQSFRRALPGVHPHRAGRVDRGDRGRAVRAWRRSAGRRSPPSWPPSSAAWRCGGCTSTAARRRARRSSPARLIPGRLGRCAYHLIHPVMVAGIIVVAAGDQLALPAPARWGTRRWPGCCSAASACSWPGTPRSGSRSGAGCPGRSSAGLVLAACWGWLAPHVSALVLSVCAARSAAGGGGGRLRQPRRGGRQARLLPPAEPRRAPP